MSWSENLILQCFSRIAAIREMTELSIFSENMRDIPDFAGTVRACISTRNTRVPSYTGAMETPGGTSLPLRTFRNTVSGFFICTRPSCFIWKRPNSSMEPNLFLAARTILRSVPELSKYRTVSTICSTVFGPAIRPSLVTWAIIMTTYHTAWPSR